MECREMRELLETEDLDEQERAELLKVEQELYEYYQDAYPKPRITDFRDQLKERLMLEAKNIQGVPLKRKGRRWSVATVAAVLILGVFTWGYAQLSPSKNQLVSTPEDQGWKIAVVPDQAISFGNGEESQSKGKETEPEKDMEALGLKQEKEIQEEVENTDSDPNSAAKNHKKVPGDPNYGIIPSDFQSALVVPETVGTIKAGSGALPGRGLGLAAKTSVGLFEDQFNLHQLLTQNFTIGRDNPVPLKFDFAQATAVELETARIFYAAAAGITPEAVRNLAQCLGLPQEKMVQEANGYRLIQSDANLRITVGPVSTIEFIRDKRAAFTISSQRAIGVEPAIQKADTVLRTLGDYHFLNNQRISVNAAGGTYDLVFQQQIDGLNLLGETVRVIIDQYTGEVVALSGRVHNFEPLSEEIPLTRELVQTRLINGDYWMGLDLGRRSFNAVNDALAPTNQVQVREMEPFIVYLAKDNDEALLVPMYRLQGEFLDQQPFEALVLAW